MNVLLHVIIFLTLQSNVFSLPVANDCEKGLACRLAIYQGPCTEGRIFVHRQAGPVCESLGDMPEENIEPKEAEAGQPEIPIEIFTQVGFLLCNLQ